MAEGPSRDLKMERVAGRELGREINAIAALGALRAKGLINSRDLSLRLISH